MLPETTISTCYSKTLCNDSSVLVLFKNVILKWMGVLHFLRAYAGTFPGCP